MPDLPSLLAFAAVSAALIAAPGPSVMFVISRAVALGRRAALLTVAGNAVGVYVQVLLVAAGLGVVVERSIVAFTTVKLVGAAYLVWLGAQAIRHRSAQSAATLSSAPDERTSRTDRELLVDGFVVGIANPKAIVFLAAFLPQFTVQHGLAIPVQMALLGLVFVALALVSDSVWGLTAGTARRWLARSPRRLERLSAGGGLVMIGLGAHLAVSGRPE